MASLRHHLIWSALRASRFRFRMGKDLTRNVATRAKPSGPLKSRFIHQEFEGHSVWRISPKGKETPARTLYHLHGGGHVYGMLPAQFPVWANLAERAQAEVIAPCYPLPPEYTARDVHGFCDRHFQHIIDEKGLENITLSGDSAGAQLALATTLTRRNRNDQNSRQLILWSPWVDLSMTNPEIENYMGAAILEPDSLIRAGLRFAGDLDIKNPLVSPLYAELSNLPRLNIFTGGRDLLYPDIVKFCSKARSYGVEVDLIEEPEMGHYWMFFPQAEAKKTLKQIAGLIK